MGARSTMLMDSADAPMVLMLLCAPGMLYWLRACTSRLSSPTAASRCPEATARMAMYPVSRIETSSMSRMGLAESMSVWCWRHRLASSRLFRTGGTCGFSGSMPASRLSFQLRRMCGGMSFSLMGLLAMNCFPASWTADW